MKVILTDRSLHGIHLTSRQKAFRTQLFFSQEKQLAKVLDRAVQLGIKDLLCTTHPLLLKLLKKEKERWPFKISVIVPNFSQFVRDSSHYGTAGAAIRRVFRMSLLHKLRFCKVSMANFEKVLGMKFEILMNLFLMAESSQFFTAEKNESRLEVKRVFLHQQIADLALALNQPGLFQLFKKIVTSEFRAEAGVITKNFVRLNSFFRQHHISIPWMISPFNPRGYWMNPNRRSCEETLKQITSQQNLGGVVPDFWNLSNTLSFDEGFSYLKSLPFKEVTLEMTDLLDESSVGWIKELQKN